MIGLDTNVLVRYLTQDDVAQAARATRVIEQELTEDAPGFIGLVALVETVWVLQRLYRASLAEIRETINDLLGCRTIVVENREVVSRALAISANKSCGFADAIVTASAVNADCAKILTFDRKAVSAAMMLIG